MQRLIQVLWPSFVVAGFAEILFFTMVNPRELYIFGEPVHFSALATYSIGFFMFWAVCAGSSLLTSYVTRGADEVNHHDANGKQTNSA